MGNTPYYQAPIDLLPTFTYGQWSGLGTITALGDLDGQRYFHVGESVPLPTSSQAAFTPVELTDELADKLRANAPTFVLPLLETASQKTAKAKAAINADRDAQLDAGVTWNGIVYPSDAVFLNALLSMGAGYQNGILTGTQTVRTKANTSVELTSTGVAQLAAAVFNYRQSVYKAAWTKKDAL